jgi:hypothetical protein
MQHRYRSVGLQVVFRHAFHFYSNFVLLEVSKFRSTTKSFEAVRLNLEAAKDC